MGHLRSAAERARTLLAVWCPGRQAGCQARVTRHAAVQKRVGHGDGVAQLAAGVTLRANTSRAWLVSAGTRFGEDDVNTTVEASALTDPASVPSAPRRASAPSAATPARMVVLHTTSRTKTSTRPFRS